LALLILSAIVTRKAETTELSYEHYAVSPYHGSSEKLGVRTLNATVIEMLKK